MAQALEQLAAPTMTFEEFLDWDSRDDFRYEWVDGKAIQMTCPSDRHQDLVVFLTAIIRDYIEQHGGGRVRGGLLMRAGPGLPARIPDVVYIAPANEGRVKRSVLDGPCDLAVELVSPDSGTTDRRDKFREYEQGGVGEYWIIDAARRQADFYQRNPDGVFAPAAPDAEGVYYSGVLPGFWLRVGWLWQYPTPTLRSVLREWGEI